MEDLFSLNKAVVARLCKTVDGAQERYVERATVLLAVLIPEAEEMLQFADTARKVNDQPENALDCIRINQQLLEYLRLQSKDIYRGEWHKLVINHLSMDQAAFLCHCSNSEILHLARFWPGEIYRPEVPYRNDLTASASTHHAAASIMMIA